MISIDKSKVFKPANLNHKPCINAIKEVIQTKSGKIIKSIYNSNSVKITLMSLYNNKCGYCECKIEKANFSERIDHYRPKDKLKDINRKPIVGHNGYYWLGYEWTNLIPTCEICNSKKLNLFPIKDETKRLSSPSLQSNGEIDLMQQLINSKFLVDEGALLLHPEFDKPEKHFVFLPSGEIKPLSDEGIATIKVCGLDRPELIVARKNRIDDIIEKLRKYLCEYDNNKKFEILESKTKDIFNQIIKNVDIRNEYSRVYYFIIQKIEIFIFDKFSNIPKHKHILIEMYKKYKKGIL